MPMQDSTQLAFEQDFQQNHAMGLAALTRENQAMGNIAEQTRLGYLEAKSAGFDLASDILQQRSVQQQPQVGVVPAAAPISSQPAAPAPKVG